MNKNPMKIRPIRLLILRGVRRAAVDPKDLITKTEGARLRGLKFPSFHELVARYPDKLPVIEIGGVEFVRRSQVRRFKTDLQRRQEQKARQVNATGANTTTRATTTR